MASLLSPLSLLLVCFLFCLPSSAVEYNETLAITMVDYAGAAYCCGNLGHGVKNWNCNACKLNPGTINITVFSDLLTQANGFVGFNVPQNRIIVAFSGTDPLDLANLIDDINIEHTKYPYCNKCKVHKGFYTAWQSVQDKIYAAVGKLTTAYPNASVAVTGHSLGAALSVHCVLGLIQDLQLTPGEKLETLYNFGDPRVGNKNFAHYYDKMMPDTFRVTHGHDPIVHLPNEFDHYYHIATEVYYNHKQTEYQVCNGSGEDKHCSDKHLTDLDLDDHLHYVYFDFTTNYLSCKI